MYEQNTAKIHDNPFAAQNRIHGEITVCGTELRLHTSLSNFLPTVY